MYCKICKKNVRSISHWAKNHSEYLHKKAKAGRKVKHSKKGQKKCNHCKGRGWV